MKRRCETCGRAHAEPCRECTACRKRRWRNNPENAERSREANRRWKRENPERVRASWYQPCPACGERMANEADLCRDCRHAADSERVAHKWNAILDLWHQGQPFMRVAKAMGFSKGHLSSEMARMRDAGVPLAYRYKPRGNSNAAARVRRERVVA